MCGAFAILETGPDGRGVVRIVEERNGRTFTEARHSRSAGSHWLDRWEDHGDPIRLKRRSGHMCPGGLFSFPGAACFKSGERFAVIVKIHTKDSVRPIAIEYEVGDMTSSVDLSDGEGYISYNGSQWESAENLYQCNVCLKVFTDKKEDEIWKK